MKISEILRAIEAHSPAGTAEDWDNVGLLVGDAEWTTSQAVVSIDLTAEAIALAEKKKAGVIVTHHPCIFPKNRGLSRVTAGPRSPMSDLVVQALRKKIAVIASHTNFDQCAMEVVATVSHGLGAHPIGRLLDSPSESLTKLVAFVPKAHADAVRTAICDAGAGKIGNYDQCAFGVEGEGTFRGSDDTRPYLGKPGKLERANEIRLETVFPSGLRAPVLKALFEAHPYEEVAYDLYPIQQGPSGVGLIRGLGYGFWGEFSKAKPFSAVVKDVKSLFNVDGFWLTATSAELTRSVRPIKRIAFVAGKGASFLDAALSQGVDLFITGEAGYHTALDGSRKGMAVMELGHRESERFFLTTMEGWLRDLGLKTFGLNLPTQRIWS